MKEKENHHIPKSLLFTNNLLIFLGCIGFIIGLVFFVLFMIEMNDKHTQSKIAELRTQSTAYSNNSNCDIPNGTYKTIYDKQFSNYPEFVFEITDDSLFTREQRLKIERSYYGIFTIEYPEINQDSLTDFQKKLYNYNKGNFYRITSCKGKSYKFENMINLHVTISTGSFMKLD